jgi:hypothetical protein
MGSGDDENERLRRAFERLPKDPSHGESVLLRHSDIRPEWVMRVIAEPHDRYEETRPGSEPKTIIVGRVPESRQWIKVVFLGNPETGLFLTAYHDHRLEDDYGGRPWDIQ